MLLARLNWFIGLLAAAGAALVVASGTGALPLGRTANIIGIVAIVAGIATRSPLKVWTFPAVTNWLFGLVAAAGAALVAAAALGQIKLGTTAITWINVVGIAGGLALRFGAPPADQPPDPPPPAPGPPALQG